MVSLQSLWFVAAKTRNRLQHALNGNTAALAQMKAIRAEMLENALDDEELDFLNMCVAFARMRVPWCIINQRRRARRVGNGSMHDDLQEGESATETDHAGDACNSECVESDVGQQGCQTLHPRYPQ